MQQVNLYTDEFQPDHSLLRLTHMLWLSGVFITLLVVFSMFYYFHVEEHANGLGLAEQRVAKLRDELAVFTVAGTATKAASWDNKIAKAEAELNTRMQIRALIQQQDFGNAKGFSAQLFSLAQNSTTDIALSSFGLHDGGRYVELEGIAYRASAVPLYLQRLHGDEAFANASFGVMALAQDEKKNAQHYFRISKAADNKHDDGKL